MTLQGRRPRRHGIRILPLGGIKDPYRLNPEPPWGLEAMEIHEGAAPVCSSAS